MLAALRARSASASLASSPSHRPWRRLRLLRPFSSSALSPNSALLELAEVEKILDDVKASDVRVIPVGEQCEWTEHMVVATGRSTWHVRNIAQALIHKVKQKQKDAERIMLPSVEGREGGKWIVIDSGNVIVHALEEKARAYYKLDSLWTNEMTAKGPDDDLEKSLVKIRPGNKPNKEMKNI